MNYNDIILVDELDNQVGMAPKMDVHEQGLLHRAFSVFIYNQHGQMLIQKRAMSKYHSAGLWTNTCCSHPSPGENTEDAAHRRLMEELGFDCEIKKLYEFTYCSVLQNGLIEHEYDHVFIGEYNGMITINELEISEVRYLGVSSIRSELKEKPETFTKWFKIAFPVVINNANEFYHD